MTSINRYVVPWGGVTALPGASVFYSTGGTDATADITAFFAAIKGLFPAALQWSVLNSGDVLDDTSGLITGTWTGTGGAVTTSTGSGSYAAGVGAYVNWTTGAVVGRRRLKGRTFLCPLVASSGYDTGGTIVTAALSTIGTAATTLAGSGKMRIWHRPPKGTFSGGTSALVVAGTVPDQVTSLRTRRR